jgi:hypothetical protein
MLFVAGDLDTSPPQPHPFPPVASWKFTIHNPFHAVYESDRRSLYLMSQRNRRHPFLTLFDAADPNMSVANRFPTITPNQTLFLMNSPFIAKRAQSLANRLLKAADNQNARIKLALETVHGTKPSPEQVEEIANYLESFLRSQAPQTTSDTTPELRAAWTSIARVLLTSNGFLYVD